MRTFFKFFLLTAIGAASFARAASHSVAPFAGYIPTYEFFFGGGYFYDSGTGFKLETEGVVTLVDSYQLRVKTDWRVAADFRLVDQLNYKRGFDPYYGEGSDTSADARLDVFGDQVELWVDGEYDIDSHFTIGAGVEARFRVENHVKDRPNVRMFPDELTPSVRVFQRADFRDREKSPHDGFLQELRVRYAPDPSFVQIEGSFAWYHELYREWVIAAQVEGAASFGDPTYLYRYRLGGSERLRGFFLNRFRGKYYYLQQTELRFPIWKIFHGGAFVDIGDISDGALQSPRISYGLGLRVGLPPDFLEKVRLDVGFAEDQIGVFFDFSHAF